MAHPGDGYDEEGPAASRLDDDCEELWVDGAEGRVPAPLRYPDVVEALRNGRQRSCDQS